MPESIPRSGIMLSGLIQWKSFDFQALKPASSKTNEDEEKSTMIMKIAMVMTIQIVRWRKVKTIYGGSRATSSQIVK